MPRMCGYISLAKVLGMSSVRYSRRLMWSQRLVVGLDLAVKDLSGLVPLVTGKTSWKPVEDSSNCISESQSRSVSLTAFAYTWALVPFAPFSVDSIDANVHSFFLLSFLFLIKNHVAGANSQARI